jgi:hypothetical protein
MLLKIGKMTPLCPKRLPGDEHTGESQLPGDEHTGESQLPGDEYTGESRLPCDEYTRESTSFLLVARSS